MVLSFLSHAIIIVPLHFSVYEFDNIKSQKLVHPFVVFRFQIQLWLATFWTVIFCSIAVIFLSIVTFCCRGVFATFTTFSIVDCVVKVKIVSV